jgi:hypothetical protein
MTAVTGLCLGRAVRKNDSPRLIGGGPIAVVEDPGGRGAHDQRSVLDHAGQMPLRGPDRDPPQVRHVRRRDGDIGFEQHPQDQLFELIKVHELRSQE